MPRPGWNGARVTAAVAFTINRDNGICWLCQHPGANSLDHIQPASTRPDLEWNPNNWRAAHLASAGHPKGCTEPGCTCTGNTGRRATPPDQPPTRRW